MFDIHDLLRLSSVPRIGPYKIRALISYFGDPSNVLAASPRELARVKGIDQKLASNIANHQGETFARDQLKRLNAVNGTIVTIWDKHYPDLLKKIYDPPAILYILGAFSPSDKYSVAIVGTRHATPYGKVTAEALSRDLTRIGITITSGLARGIDTVAHHATLQAGGRTIGVIGSGLDVPYPPENRKLLERITHHGVIVSEFPMGAKPDATNFPRRNRVISGLSLGTVVIESGEDGGAMITATIALDQNREVFAVPGNITEKRSTGPNMLIRDGKAKLITGVDDIVEELKHHLRGLIHEERRSEPEVELTLFERKLIDVLGSDPIHIDTIAETAALSTSDALVNLLSLEFKGLVKQLPGKQFLRV